MLPGCDIYLSGHLVLQYVKSQNDVGKIGGQTFYLFKIMLIGIIWLVLNLSRKPLYQGQINLLILVSHHQLVSGS